MKYLIAAFLALASSFVQAQVKPLVIANDAWRQSALQELAPLLRICLPRADQTTPARLPLAKGQTADINGTIVLQEPAVLGQGYWYRLGWRASDGTVFIVAARSPDGQRMVFGPVAGDWACLPGEIRRQLGGR
jgi:hypothetical protein